MNLLIVGASGATGQHLVRLALDQGHRVTAFVRDAGRMTLSSAHSEHRRSPSRIGGVGSPAYRFAPWER